MDRALDAALRRRRGSPGVYDLTPCLGGYGSWTLEGWRVANTDEAELYYSTAKEGFFVLVIKRLARPDHPHAWMLQNMDQVCDRAAEHLTPKDMTRFVFAISWLPR